MDFDMQIMVWLFILALIPVDAANMDVECLKSIKESLADPKNLSTSTWRFDNRTEGFICRFPGVKCWHPDESKVLSIMLSNMGLVGSFPRGLGNCTSLTGLDLSRNKLSGPLPPDISRLIGFVVDLDLSSNSFSGEIPADFANCTYLNGVSLESNQLQGQIPPELGGLSRLRYFSVANNYLSGPVPLFRNTEIFITEDYAHNNGLCGGPLPSCHLEESNEVKKLTIIGGFMVGWVVSALVTLLLSLFYMPNVHCASVAPSNICKWG